MLSKMHQTRAQLVQTKWKAYIFLYEYKVLTAALSHTLAPYGKGRRVNYLSATGQSYVLDSWPVYGILAGLSLLALLWPQDLNVNEYFVSPWGSGQDEQGLKKIEGGEAMKEGDRG